MTKTETQAALEAYENLWGPAPPSLIDEIVEYHETVPAEWWEDAFEQAWQAGAKSWRYVKAILDRCLAQGQAPGLPKAPATARRPSPEGFPGRAASRSAEERDAYYLGGKFGRVIRERIEREVAEGPSTEELLARMREATEARRRELDRQYADDLARGVDPRFLEQVYGRRG